VNFVECIKAFASQVLQLKLRLWVR